MTEEVKRILDKLSVEEKIALCSGKDFWHTEAVNCEELPEVMMCDGPHGLRKQEEESDHLGINESIKTVCYPSASALAASFDLDVLSELGNALGQECQAENIGMLLGPGLNMKEVRFVAGILNISVKILILPVNWLAHILRVYKKEELQHV